MQQWEEQRDINITFIEEFGIYFFHFTVVLIFEIDNSTCLAFGNLENGH